MPKPMRTHPRGAAGAATLCSLGLLVACCGCPGMLWKPELPKAVNIVIQADGSITVDGTPETSSMDMLELIKQKVEVRQKALQAVPPPAVPLPPAQQPREVLITFASPENSTYRDLFRALLACGIARLVDLEGIPMSFPNEAPSTDGPNPPNPPWLPLDIAGPADLPKLQAHAADLNGRAVMLRAGVDTPLTLVLDILRTIHASGGTFGFIFFDDAIAKSGKTHVIIETGVLCPNGGVNMSPKTTAEMRARFEARRKKSNAVPTTGPVSPNFFGVPIGKPPRKIVFILDRSGSMTDSIDFVKHELKRCVGCLADSDRFHIIFFSSGPPVEMPPRQLVAANNPNKQAAFEFIDGVIAQGETDPSEALRRAFAEGPDTILFLSDGEFDRAIPDLIRRLNVGRKVVFNTIGFLYSDAGVALAPIAAENGGVYRFVSEEDLAALPENLR